MRNLLLDETISPASLLLSAPYLASLLVLPDDTCIRRLSRSQRESKHCPTYPLIGSTFCSGFGPCCSSQCPGTLQDIGQGLCAKGKFVFLQGKKFRRARKEAFKHLVQECRLPSSTSQTNSTFCCSSVLSTPKQKRNKSKPPTSPKPSLHHPLPFPLSCHSLQFLLCSGQGDRSTSLSS